MSEDGWRGFLAAEGVDDWVVLHGGATAVFRAGSLFEAARLAEAVAEIAGLAGRCVDDVIDGLTVRLTAALSTGVSVTSSSPERSPRSRGNREPRWTGRGTGGAALDRGEAGLGRCRLLARGVGYGEWPMTTPSTPSATDRRSGCRSWTAKSLRHAMHVDVRSPASRPRGGSPRRWRPAAGSWTTEAPALDPCRSCRQPGLHRAWPDGASRPT